MKNTLNTEFPGIGDAQFHIRLTEGQISPTFCCRARRNGSNLSKSSGKMR